MPPKGSRHTAEARAKMSAAKKGIPTGRPSGATGKTWSLEARERASAARIGIPKSPEHAAKLATILSERNASPEMRKIASESKIGAKHWRWNALGWKQRGQYRQVRIPDHPFSRGKGGWFDQHRAIAEILLERALTPREEIHHINGDKCDNRPENLYVAPTKRAHMLAHSSLQKAAYRAVKLGLITFNDGRYEVPD